MPPPTMKRELQAFLSIINYLGKFSSRTVEVCELLQKLTRDNMSCHRGEVPDSSILRPIAFTSKILTEAGKRYSNIEREALGILYGLEKFHHCYFAREVSIITDHKPFITIFKKVVATLSQRLRQILKNTSVQGQNHIQTQTRLIHGRLAVQTKSQEK